MEIAIVQLGKLPDDLYRWKRTIIAVPCPGRFGDGGKRGVSRIRARCLIDMLAFRTSGEGGVMV
jgi:hypothetical protein